MGKSSGGSGTPGQIVDVTPDEFLQLRGPIVDVLLGQPIGTTTPVQPTQPVAVPQQTTRLGAQDQQVAISPSGPAPSPPFVPLTDRALGGLLSGGPAFEGEFTAGLTPEEQQLLSLISGQFGPSSPTQAASEAGLETLRAQASGEFLNQNPFLQDAIRAAQRPTVQSFNELLLGQRGQFTAAGQFIGPEGVGSSPFERARAITGRGAFDALGDIATRLSAADFSQGRELQQRAAEVAPQISKVELDRTIEGLRAVALPRLIEQFGLDKGLEEFRRQMNVITQALALSIGAASPDVAVLQATAAPQQEGIGSLIGGLASLASFIPFGCWVAREVYGADNPQWLMFRQWMFTRAPKWLLGLYLKYGERLALWLRGKDRLKAVIRRWMDARVRTLNG